MGIYLSNMEMPKGCASCPFYDDECFGAYKCDAVQSWGSDTERASGCPLVPVPPHGRLGDLDAVPWYLANTSVKYATYEDWEMLCDAIAAAPTVIPASEEG